MTLGNTDILLGPVFQTAYVTTDMDRALAVFKEKYGVEKFVRSPRRMVTLDSGAKMTIDLCLGWVGEMLIEVIQPLAGQVNVFADWLPREGFGLRFHHTAIRLFSMDEWDHMLITLERRKHRIILQVTNPILRALYIDTIADLGHYIEYLYYTDVPNSSLPLIPQNISGHLTAY